MSSTKKLIENAIKNTEITDYIMLIRGECMTAILVEDFIKDIVFGGELICDTLLGCWKTMGQFDGGTNPDNGDEDECDCDPDFVKIHFPKGEGIKIIDEEGKATVPDSIYPIKVGENQFQLVIVDEEGNKRNLAPLNQIELISSDNTVNIEITDDGETDLTVDFPVVNGESIGAGIPLYKGLVSKKIRTASLKTDNLTITEELDGSVKINYPESGSTSNASYFVDQTYVPTPSSPSDGSRSRPFTTLTIAVNAMIGTGTRLNPIPLNSGKAIITLLSDVEDSINPTINNITFRIEGGKTYTYTGTNTYIFDFEPLFNQAKILNGPLTQNITAIIRGEGNITRENGTGHFQNKNDNTYPGSVSTDPMSLIRIIGEGTGLYFGETNSLSGYTPLTTKDGDLLYTGGTLVYGANIAPSIPMFNLIGESDQYWGTEISGTRITIETYSQVGLRTSGSAYVHCSDAFVVDQSSRYIGYQTRDVSGTEVLYTPYPTRNDVEILDGGHLQIDTFSFLPDAPDYTKVNSIFKLTSAGTKGSILDIIQELKPIPNKGAINFIEYSGVNNLVQLNNAKITGAYTNFVKGDNTNSLEILFASSNIDKVVNNFYQSSTTSIVTNGTWSTMKAVPYNTTIPIYSDNTSAKAVLGTNAVYKTPAGAIQITY